MTGPFVGVESSGEYPTGPTATTQGPGVTIPPDTSASTHSGSLTTTVLSWWTQDSRTRDPR